MVTTVVQGVNQGARWPFLCLSAAPSTPCVVLVSMIVLSYCDIFCLFYHHDGMLLRLRCNATGLIHSFIIPIATHL